VLNHLPSRRVVIGFRLRVKGQEPGRRSFWLLLQPGEVSLCPGHPGFEEDLWITSDPAALYRVFLGRISLDAAIETGVRVDGPPALIRALPRWFRLSSRRAAPATPTPQPLPR
jgi:hypothetical protein